VRIRLTPKEIEWLVEFDGGPFGEDTFTSFMAALCVRLNDETREIDIDRDEQEQIASFERDPTHQAIIQRIFRRAIDAALNDFLG
jgi:hypothetical protein